jgi:hypothetical protein
LLLTVKLANASPKLERALILTLLGALKIFRSNTNATNGMNNCNIRAAKHLQTSCWLLWDSHASMEAAVLAHLI